MKAVDCKSARLEIAAADISWQPEDHTQAHLQGCSACRSFYDQELKLRRLIGDLETISAPPDFDFRLRARLANDKTRPARRVTVGGIAFGLPSLTLATFLILVGAAFLFRSTTTIHTTGPVAVTVQPVTSPALNSDQNKLLPVESPIHASTAAPDDNSGRGTLAVVRRPRSQRNRAPSSQRTVSRDFSNTPAEVIHHRQTASDEVAVFPIDTPAQSLQLSLDDGNGVSRTISLPRVSFGSQRFVADGSPTLIKTSSKGVW